MNEEDKKIIDKLNKTIDFNSTLYIDDLGDNDIKDILNLITKQQRQIETIKEENSKLIYKNVDMYDKKQKIINKQQKEIEELNTELQIRIKWQQYFEKEYINKDKIREKIKVLKNKKIGASTGIYEVQVDILEELLKE